MRRKICTLWLACALTVALAGCAARAKNITSIPAGITQTQVQNWDAAVAYLQKISQVTTTLRQSVISLNKSGIFPDGPAYANTLAGIGKIDELQIEASNYLQGVPSDWSLATQQKILAETQQIQAILTNITNTGIVGIKDPASQSQVATLISNIGSVAALIIGLTA